MNLDEYGRDIGLDHTHHLITEKYAPVALLKAFMKVMYTDTDFGQGGLSWYAAWFYDTIFEIKKPLAEESRIDLNMTGYKNPTRWNRLVKDYVNKSNWLAFEEEVTKNLKPNNQASFLFGNQADHIWGNCLIGMSVHCHNKGRRVAMFTRASWMVPLGPYDMSLGIELTRRLATITDSDPDEWTLKWYVSQMGFNTWMIQPYLHTIPDDYLNANRHRLSLFGERAMHIYDSLQTEAGKHYWATRKFAAYKRWTRGAERVRESQMGTYFAHFDHSLLREENE